MTEPTPIVHELVVWRRGVAVAWNDAYGPAVAVLSSPTAVRATGATHLPAGSAAGGEPPSLCAWRLGVAAAWVDREAAMLALIDAGGGLHAPPLAVHHGARATSVGQAGELLAVASVDESGIVVSWVDVREHPQVVETRRTVEATDVGGQLCVLPADHGVLVVYLTGGGNRLGVAHVDADREHVPRDVKHPLRGSVATMRAASVRGLRALALSYESEQGGRVDLALLDASGRVRERPHAVISRTGARLAHAHPVWIETGFVVAAIDEVAGELHIASVPEERGVTACVRADPGPTRMDFWQRRLVVTRLLATGDRLALAVRSLDDHGTQDGTSHVDVSPPDTAQLAGRRRSRQVLDAVQARLTGRGYRDAGTSARRSPDGLELQLRIAGGRGLVRAGGEAQATRLDLVVGPEGAELPGELPPEPVLRRLGQWLRSLLSRRVARSLEADRGWATATFTGARVTRIARAGPLLAVVLLVQDRPEPQVVLRWLEAMHERLRELHGGEEVADRPGNA